MFSRVNLDLGKQIAHAVAVASHFGANGVDDETVYLSKLISSE